MQLKSGFLALLGLATFAIAHPLLDGLGHGSTFFVTHGAETPDILAFALTIYLLPAALLISAVGCTRLFSVSAAKPLISIFAGMLAGLWTMGIASALPAIVAIAIALVFGSVIGLCYFIFPRLRELLQILGLLSPLVVVYFLAFTPVKSLILPRGDFEGGSMAISKTPIVIILFDELSLAAITTPDGEIDAGRLPNFARLERISTWYRNTTTASTLTHRAVPALLSGMRPKEGTQPVYGEFPRNLFTLLGARQTINAREVYTRLCPRKICPQNGPTAQSDFDTMAMYRDVRIVWLHSILPADLAEKYLPSISNRWSNFSLEEDDTSDEDASNAFRAEVTDMMKDQSLRFNEFVSSLRNNTGATVNYFHLALPHHPWIYLPDGTKYNGTATPGKTTTSYGWSDNQYLVDEIVLRYSLQVEYVDSLLGQALDALEQIDHFSQVMLIVTSDHGIGFAPGKPARTPDISTLADVARVPLFIKFPGQPGGARDERRVETIDIFPTIADVKWLPLNGTTDGQSLLAENWTPAVRHVFEGGSSFPDFERDMDMKVASERIYRVLKPGVSALDAMGHGSAKQYIGQPAPVSNGAETQFTLELDNSRWYMAVDRSTGFLPARMTGKLRGANLGTEIIVALNGITSGSGMTYDESGSISIMLDPRKFIDGANKIQAYVIDVSGISEIDVSMDFEGWSIRRDDEGIVTVTDAQGTSFHRDDALTGRAGFSAHNQSLRGYACDEVNRLAPNTVLLVEGDAVITSTFSITSAPIFKNEAEAPGLECWFSLDRTPGLGRKAVALSIVALFEDGRMLEIHPKKK